MSSNLVFKEFKGCGLCDIKDNCRGYEKKVNIKFNESQKADSWGKLVTVFEKGEIVSGHATIKDNEVYCACAKSNKWKGYFDFIRLENIEIYVEDSKLEEYVKNNPDEMLVTGLTVLGKWYIRPISWCGSWKDGKLLNGNCLAYFDTKEDLDKEFIRIGYEIQI